MNAPEISSPRYILSIRFDLFAHFSMFFGLSFLFFFEKYRKNKDKILKSSENHKYILLIVLFGFFIELFQPILSNRSRELYDFLADVIGSYTGYSGFLLLRKFFFTYF